MCSNVKRYSRSTVRVQRVYTRVQSAYSGGTLRVQSVSVQQGYSQGTAGGVQSGYSWGYSQGTVGVQSWYSRGTVRVQQGYSGV